MATAPLSFAVPDQHARLADRAVAGTGPAGDAGRHPGRRAGPLGGNGLRLDLVPERLADRPGGAAGLAQQPRVAQGIPGDAAGPARGGHRRLRLRDHRLHGASRARRRCGPGPAARAAPQARPAADARFRPQPHGPGSSLGRGPSRVLHPGHGAGPGPAAAELHLGQAQARRLLLAYGRDPYFPGWPDTCSSTTPTRPRRKR